MLCKNTHFTSPYKPSKIPHRSALMLIFLFLKLNRGKRKTCDNQPNATNASLKSIRNLLRFFFVSMTLSTQTLTHLWYTWGLFSRLCFCYVLLSQIFCLSLYSWAQCVHPPLSVSHYRSIETSSQVTHKELILRAFSHPQPVHMCFSFFFQGCVYRFWSSQPQGILG